MAILGAIGLKDYTPFTATTSVNAKTVKTGHVVFTVEYTDEDGDSPLTYSITSTAPAGAPFQFSAGMFILYWFSAGMFILYWFSAGMFILYWFSAGMFILYWFSAGMFILYWFSAGMFILYWFSAGMFILYWFSASISLASRLNGYMYSNDKSLNVALFILMANHLAWCNLA